MLLQTLKKSFLKDPAKLWFWIFLGILVKTLPLLFLLHNRPTSDMPGIWGATMDDTHTYIDPIEDFLKTGTYNPGYRMPGYGFIFLLFRLFLPYTCACNILITFQFLLAGISVYYLALTAKHIFKDNRPFYICYYLFLISIYSNYFDGWLLTESLCCSALILSVWFFVKYYQTFKSKNLLFSGLLITWAIFLRPVFLPVILVYVFILIFHKQSQTPREDKVRIASQSPFNSWRQTILFFLLPFLLIDGAWITFNYTRQQKIIPLTNLYVSKADTTYERPLREFIRSWGGSADFADNTNYMLWFGFHLGGMPNPKTYSVQLPDYIYTSKFNKDSLLELKGMITSLNDSILSSARGAQYESELKEKLRIYRLSLINEKPFLYYFQAPVLHCLPHFLLGPETKIYLKRFNLSGILGSVSKGIFTFYYYFIIILGIAGAVTLLFKGLSKNKLILLAASIPSFTIIVHSCILRFTDNRYLMPAWAFLIICASYIIVRISGKFKTEK